MFCFTCLIFADKSSYGYDKSFAEATAGCGNFKKGLEKLVGGIHLDAVSKMLVTRYTLEKDYMVVKSFIEGKKREEERNREIMWRLLDVTLFLSKQNLAFRAHHEKVGKWTESENEGNFIELVKKQVWSHHEKPFRLIQ